MFTDRFIKVPSTVVDKKQKEMFGEDTAEKTPVMCRINPYEINDYREDTDGGATVIYFKNGSEMVVDLSIEDFEKLLNNSYEPFNN